MWVVKPYGISHTVMQYNCLYHGHTQPAMCLSFWLQKFLLPEFVLWWHLAFTFWYCNYRFFLPGPVGWFWGSHRCTVTLRWTLASLARRTWLLFLCRQSLWGWMQRRQVGWLSSHFLCGLPFSLILWGNWINTFSWCKGRVFTDCWWQKWWWKIEICKSYHSILCIMIPWRDQGIDECFHLSRRIGWWFICCIHGLNSQWAGSPDCCKPRWFISDAWMTLR